MKFHIKKSKQEGITLIALVITIIIILILAAVSIKTLGSNGIIAQAKWSAYVTEYESVDEAVKIYVYEKEMEKYKNYNTENEEKQRTIEEIDALYPIKEELKDSEVSKTLKSTIMKLENVEESDFSDKKKVDLRKVDFSSLNAKIETKKQYAINIATGMVYSVEYEKYKGNYYHTPRLGISSKGDDKEEIPEEDAISIHYKLGEEEIYTQKVSKDAKVAKLEAVVNMNYTFSKPLMYWKDITEDKIEADDEYAEDTSEGEEETSSDGIEENTEEDSGTIEEEITTYLDQEEISIEGTDVYLEAVCGENTIQLNTNGGKFDDGTTEKTWSVNNGEKYGEMPDPVNENGYVFEGWFTETTDGEQIVEDDIYNGTVTVLYAHWATSNIITVKYNLTDANATCSVQEKKSVLNAKIGKLPTKKQTQKATYVFDCWIDKNGNKVKSTTKVTEDLLDGNILNLYARFTIHMNFDYNGGTYNPQYRKSLKQYKNVKIGGKRGRLYAYAIKKDCKENGWWINRDGTPVKTSTGTQITETSDFVIYAEWLEKYTISYNLNYDNAETPKNKTAWQNSKFTSKILYTQNKRDGYAFDGWYKEPECNNKVNIGDNITGNITLYAKWEQRQGLVYSESEDLYLIQNATDLKYLSTQVNTSSSTKIVALEADGQYWNTAHPESVSRDYVASTAKYKVTNDIDLNPDLNSKNSWEPIGKNSSTYFKGTFDGNNKTINNLYINTTSPMAGLFGDVSNGTIKNITLKNVDIYSTSYFVGGIIGNGFGSLIEGCKVYGTIQATGYTTSSSAAKRTCVGGIIGQGSYQTANTIKSCTNYAQITSTYSCIGGIAGSFNKGEITDSYNLGKITLDGTASTNGCGGITGKLGRLYNDTVKGSANIYNCINYGEVVSNGYATGGIAGNLTNSSSVNYCANYKDVTTHGKDTNNSSAAWVGGIVGFLDKSGTNKITYSYNIGKITADYSRVGGIVGSLRSSKCSVLFCYNKGEVSGSSYVGGISGNNSGTVGDSYYLEGVVKTTSKDQSLETNESTLKGLASQDGWKDYFVEDTENKNDGYPIFSWQK